MSLNGSAVLLSINTGTTESPTMSVIPCQVTGDYSLSVATRNTSCKGSADETNAPGSRSRSISLETIPTGWMTLADTPAGAEQVLRHSAETGVQVTGQVVVSGVAVEEFTATIEGMTLSAPREDNFTASFDLAISGAMRPVDES